MRVEAAGVISIDGALALEPLRADHAAAYAALIDTDREHLARWLPWAQTSRGAGDVGKYIATVVERRALDRGDAFAILVQGAVAGAIDLHDVNRVHDVASLGYWLACAHQGRGVMTRAVRVLTEWAFRERRVHRLEILAAVDNAASRAVAERAGFAFEAMLRDRLRTARGYEDGALYVRVAGAGA